MKLFKLWKTYSNFTSIHCTFLNTHTPFQENPWRILSQVSWIHTQQFCNVAQCLAAWQRQGSTPVSDVTLYQQRTARSKIIVKYQWNKFMKGRPRGNIFLWKNFESTGWHFRAVYRAEMSTRALKEDDIIHAIVYLNSNYNHVLLLTVWCIVLRHISFCNSVGFLVVLQWSLLLGSLWTRFKSTTIFVNGITTRKIYQPQYTRSGALLKKNELPNRDCSQGDLS